MRALLDYAGLSECGALQRRECGGAAVLRLQVICSGARRFFGTMESSFSAYVLSARARARVPVQV